MTEWSIRRRLTAWYSAVLLGGLVLFAAGMWFALEQRLIAGLDARLHQRLMGLETALAAEDIGSPERLRQEVDEFAVEIPDGALIQLEAAAGAPPSADWPVRRTLTRGGRSYRAATAPLRAAGNTYRALVAIPMDETAAVMRDFRQLLFLMAPPVLALACLGGYWLSSRALRPVDAITRAAELVSVQNLSQRVAVPLTGDELQRMAQAWNGVLERLEASVARIRQFTADASHELRTPLALIRTTAELALRRPRTVEEYRHSLELIEDEAKRMTGLAESLLTVARADAGVFEMQLQPTDLEGLVESVAGQLAPAASAAGVRLIAQSHGGPATISANEPGIRRLLLILLDNALRHTPAGGQVRVSAQTADGSVVLAVEDTGEGIAAEALPHIFDRFYRGDPARGGGVGFGLGLSIAQAIAQAHGSQVQVDSHPGAGARFSLRFTQFSDSRSSVRT